MAFPAHASISRTDVEIAQGAERVSLYSSQPIELVKSFALQNPPRFVVDIRRMSNGAGVGLSRQYHGALLKDVRFGQFDATTSRIVIDLAGSSILGTASVMPANGQQYKLVIDVKGQADSPVTTSPRAQRYLPSSGAQQTSSWTAPIPVDKPKADALEAKKPLVVIDAGHGGKDTGAIGTKGTREKNVTLQYARALQHQLLQSGRYKVLLTRDSDKYLFLNERVAIARQHKADVFISLHADSNPNSSAKGLSIYTVSEKASDAEAAALAARENKSDIIGGVDLSHEDKMVADILIDLAQRETKNKSSDLAETLLENMHNKIPLLPNTHRYAGFRVLKAPDVPSVLLEIGFLTNTTDERVIQTREYQDKVTRSLVKGLDAYFGL